MEVRWTSMPPNGCAADRRAPGACARRVEVSADSGEKKGLMDQVQFFCKCTV
jgi:hypothetical protein